MIRTAIFAYRCGPNFASSKTVNLLGRLTSPVGTISADGVHGEVVFLAQRHDGLGRVGPGQAGSLKFARLRQCVSVFGLVARLIPLKTKNRVAYLAIT